MPDLMRNNVTFRGYMADVATTSLTWTFIGGAWGAFNPYPVGVDLAQPGRKVFPLPPFSSLASVGYYAGLFGSITIVKFLSLGGLAFARNRRDLWNDLVGVGAVYGYARFLFLSEKRVYWNNCAFAGIAISSVIYANTAP
jgi:hypothetical protein